MHICTARVIFDSPDEVRSARRPPGGDERARAEDVRAPREPGETRGGVARGDIFFETMRDHNDWTPGRVPRRGARRGAIPVRAMQAGERVLVESGANQHPRRLAGRHPRRPRGRRGSDVVWGIFHAHLVLNYSS